MTIDGVSGRTAYIASSLSGLKSQLETLTEQLSSGKKSTTYAGLGDAAGTRALIGVLLLHRTMAADAVSAGMTAAIAAHTYDPDLVAVQARMSLPHNTINNSEPVPVMGPW